MAVSSVTESKISFKALSHNRRILCLYLLGNDKNDVAEVQVQIPI
jgi:hypothetical protein